MRLTGKTAQEIRAIITKLEATRTQYEQANAGKGDPAVAGWREIERDIKDARYALVREEIRVVGFSRVGPIDKPWEMKNKITALEDLRRSYELLKPAYYQRAIKEINKALTDCYRKLAKMEVTANVLQR